MAKKEARVIIIGAGFGGLQAAKALGRTSAKVTLIDRCNHHVFQPLLYQVATAGLSPAEIAAPIRHILRGRDNIDVVMGEATDIDLGKRTVTITDLVDTRILEYDYLIVATGAMNSHFGHHDWEAHAPGLKTIEDATAIRTKILLAFESAELEPDDAKRERYLTFVIVGGGPTGVELAGAIAELAKRTLAREFRRIDPGSARIILVEAGPRILPTFPEQLANAAQRALQGFGVEVRTNSPVELIDADGVVISGARTATATVLWAAGVRATPAGSWLGVETDRGGRVSVTPNLTLPNRPEVFVIGDAAAASQGGEVLPGIAPVAMQQGNYVGRLIAGNGSTKPFHFRDKGVLATVGRFFAVGMFGRRGISGRLAWLAWVFVHIYYLIDFRQRAVVMLQWIWAYVTYQRGARLITWVHRAPPND